MTARWTVVVPVKPAAVGKSRLDVPGVDRVALARAIALDTIAAAAACGAVSQVVVVGDDGGLVMLAADIPGLRFVPEDEPAGLDAAVALGVEGFTGFRAALLGDLPSLRPEDLAAALTLAEAHDRAVVADAEGTGSTLVTAAPDVPWESSFGDGSFARHVALGCVALRVPDASTLRRDVDTRDQLLEARELGLGPRTAGLLER
ncbi:MAG: 2-phospho-L-lactate guanylyltransferase [Microbacterium sp.]